MFANSLSDKLSPGQLTEHGRQIGFDSLNDATLFVKRFDSDEDGCLSYWEFANVLLPQDQSRSKQVQHRTELLGVGTNRNLATLRVLISKVIDVEYRCHSMRLECCNQISK